MSNTINCQHCGVEIGLVKPGIEFGIAICIGCVRMSHYALMDSQKSFEEELEASNGCPPSNGEYAAAAATYALYNVTTKPFKAFWQMFWPFEPEQFEPTPCRTKNLVAALCYIVAELNNIEAKQGANAKPCLCTVGSTCMFCEEANKGDTTKTTAQ